MVGGHEEDLIQQKESVFVGFLFWRRQPDKMAAKRGWENLKIKKPKALIEHHKKMDDITGLRLDHLHDLHSQLVDTLEWIKSLPYDNKRGAYKSNIISWTSISNAEIHIMRKLEIYLKQFTKPSRIHWGPNQREAFRNTLQKGYQCTTEEMEVQSRISNIISMDICSEIEW